jgi:hypothetical protein
MQRRATSALKKKLMSLSDLAFTKHANRVYDERLVVPTRGTWKSRAERDAARLEIVDVLKRLAPK